MPWRPGAPERLIRMLCRHQASAARSVPCRDSTRGDARTVAAAHPSAYRRGALSMAIGPPFRTLRIELK